MEFQLQAIEGQVERIPDSVAKACDCLHRIEKRLGKLTEQCSLCNKPFLLAATIKQRLEELGIAVESANDKILNFEKVSCFFQGLSIF